MAELEGAAPLHFKPFWYSRTVWVNAATLVGALLTALIGYGQFSPLWLAVLSGVNLWLRTITTQPVSSSALQGGVSRTEK